MAKSLKKLLNLKKASIWAKRNPDWAALPFLILMGLVIVGIASEMTDNTSTATEKVNKFVPILPQAELQDSDSLLNQSEDSSFERSYVLQNPEHKVSKDFQIPNSISKRVGFYFDLFTKYDKNKLIIFSANDPSLVFEVVDIEDLQRKNITLQKKQKLIGLRAQAKIQQVRGALNLIQSQVEEGELSKKELSIKNLIHRWGGRSNSALQRSTKYISFAIGQKDRFKELVEGRQYELTTIETVLKAHSLPWEYSRLYLLPPRDQYTDSLSLNLDLKDSVKNKYLLATPYANESKSPIKTARVLAKLMKSSSQKNMHNYVYFKGDLRAAFLAALHAERYVKSIFSDLNIIPNPFEIRAVRLKRTALWSEVLEKSKAKELDLISLNPDLKDSVLKSNLPLPKGFVLFIPKAKSNDVAKLSE